MPEIKLSYGRLKNDPDTFNALSKLHSDLSEFEDEEIFINCSQLSWFDAHLSGPLRTIVAHAIENRNEIHLRDLKPDVRDILSKNGLLKRKIADVHKTTMPLRRFELTESKEFAQYTKTNLSRPEMPKMTVQLARKFHEGLDELFANCSMHSGSRLPITVSGQFYPRNNLVSISISDGGIGICGSLTKANIRYRNHSQAIAWAMERNNTSRVGDVPGGLGLAVLRDFVTANRGKLLVVSKKGYWCQTHEGVSRVLLDHEFPGTAAILEINTADKNAYDLASNLKSDEIW